MYATGTTHSIRRMFIEHRQHVMTIAVLGWSAKYLVELSFTHTTGAEIYGVVTAAVSVGAALAGFKVLASARPWWPASAAVVALFAVVALAGVAGTIAHIIGPVAGHGPVDLRPRPVAAPLIFTLLGFVGGAAQVLGYRAGARRVREAEVE